MKYIFRMYNTISYFFSRSILPEPGIWRQILSVAQQIRPYFIQSPSLQHHRPAGICCIGGRYQVGEWPYPSRMACIGRKYPIAGMQVNTTHKSVKPIGKRLGLRRLLHNPTIKRLNIFFFLHCFQSYNRNE